MLARTKKPPIKSIKKSHSTGNDAIICMQHAGALYQFPKKIAEKYRISDQSINANELFFEINKKYTRPGALLRGIRVRENLTQIEMAKKLLVTQSDISQMERGVRKIGRIVAQRIEKLFKCHYRSFLE